MTADVVADEATPPERGHGATAWVFAAVAPIAAVALILGLTFGIGAGDASDTAPGSTHGGVGLTAAPLDLASVPAELAAHFTYAEQHEHEYGQIPCYCGCEEFLGHRNLYDCFVRSDGRGYDAHAAGCGVCIGESATARRLLDEGLDPIGVRDAVVAQFGSTPGTVPPGA